MTSPLHPSPGGVVTFTGWGPPPATTGDPATAARLERVLRYFASNGAPTPKLSHYQLSFPGQVGGPTFTYLVFSRPGFDDVVAELGLAIASPHVTLGQLMVHFRFGNPFSVPMLQEPTAPAPPIGEGATRPIDPVGEAIDRAPGRYHSLPGDDWALFDKFTKADGRVFEKRGYRLSFGWFVWWERIS